MPKAASQVKESYLLAPCMQPPFEKNKEQCPGCSSAILQLFSVPRKIDVVMKREQKCLILTLSHSTSRQLQWNLPGVCAPRLGWIVSLTDLLNVLFSFPLPCVTVQLKLSRHLNWLLADELCSCSCWAVIPVSGLTACKQLYFALYLHPSGHSAPFVCCYLSGADLRRENAVMCYFYWFEDTE